MNDNAKTGVFVGGAAVLTLIALVSTPSTPEPEFFNDEGESFFSSFEDPAAAASLEVWEFDVEKTEPVAFKVEQKAGRWTIPSHSNYAADAKSRMAKAASLVIGLRKDRVLSDLKSDHAAFGVLDPLDAGLEVEGRGKRVTFKDSQGNVLADLILGKEVDGRLDQRYVRLPGKKRTYAVKLDAELSTKFEDWIERDLLKTTSYDLTELVFDNYSVDERTFTVQPGEKLRVVKDDASKWVLDGLAEDEETNSEKVVEAVDALTGVKIVGVRRKPDGLTAALERASGFDRRILMDILVRKGYFPGEDGKVYSNEGDLVAQTGKGIVYTLKFGEIVWGSGAAITAGTDETPEPKQGDDQGPQPPEGRAHRYLMVTAMFDEKLIDAPDGVRLDQEKLDLRKQAREEIEKIVAALERHKQSNEAYPDTLAPLTEGEAPLLAELSQDPWEQDFVYRKTEDGYLVLSMGEDKAEGGEGVATDLRSDAMSVEDDFQRAFDDWQARDKKVEDGRKEADELAARFAPWYYVIDAESFDKLHLQRADLAQKKPVEEPKDGEQGANKDGENGK